jgi:U4/U6.U5 tri-snRNP-associated protein 2
VIDSSLDDIKRCLVPAFAPDEIQALSVDNTVLARDIHGVSYLPGFVGLNNLNCTDYFNTVLHALSHVIPVRDFFLDPSNYVTCRNSLVTQFGHTLRKLWSRHNFKSVVSPQELLHEISVASQKRFTVGKKV